MDLFAPRSAENLSVEALNLVLDRPRLNLWSREHLLSQMPSAFDLIAGGKALVPYYAAGLGPNSTVQTTDPTASNDITQGFQIGALWFNSTSLRIWSCRSNTQGAAAWVFEGSDYTNGGTNPNIELTQFGLGTNAMGEEGNIFRYVSSGTNPQVTGSDVVLLTFSLSALSFDQSGRGLSLTAQGSCSGTTSQTTKIYVGGTITGTVGSLFGTAGGATVIASGTGGGASSAGGWALAANLFKYGALASNTQVALHQAAQFGSVIGPLQAPTLLTATENAVIPVVVTAQVTGTVGQLQLGLNYVEVNAVN